GTDDLERGRPLFLRIERKERTQFGHDAIRGRCARPCRRVLGAGAHLGGRPVPCGEQSFDLSVRPRRHLRLDADDDGGARLFEPSERAGLVARGLVAHSTRSQTGNTRYSTPSRTSVRPAERNAGRRASAVSKPTIRLWAG